MRIERTNASWVEMAMLVIMVGIGHGRQFEHFPGTFLLVQLLNEAEARFRTYFL